MRVSEIMTRRPVTVSHDAKLHQVISLLARNKITGCPVVDGKRRILGMVTQKDILSLIDVRDGVKKSESLPLILAAIKGNDFKNLRSRIKSLRNKRVDRIMTRKIVSVSETFPLYDAISLMNSREVSRLPVVRGEKLVGILSRSDIIKALK